MTAIPPPFKNGQGGGDDDNIMETGRFMLWMFLVAALFAAAVTIAVYWVRKSQ